MGRIRRQRVRREAVSCLGLLFDILHGQRDGQLPALGAAQTDDHKHRRHDDRADGHQLAGPQAGIADEQRVGAQALDPGAAQAVPDDVA